MKRVLMSFATTVLLVAPSLAVAQTVATKERSYIVKYQDGTSETYVARYSASVNDNIWEDGHPSIPAKGWFVDTRQCHWHITSQIQRDVCLVSKAGQQFCQGALTRLFGTDYAGKGSDFVVLKLAPEDCGGARPRHDSDVNNVKQVVAQSIDGVVQKDSQQLEADLKTQLKAISVSPK